MCGTDPMMEHAETLGWGASIPLDRGQAQVLLGGIDSRATKAELARMQRVVAARDATIDVLRLDAPAARAPRPRGALAAFRWPRSSGDFDSATIEPLADSGLFLAGWYAVRHGEAIGGADPWTHFIASGIAAGLAPNPFFDPGWYADTHLEGRHDEPAILHYVRIGARYALAPGPLFDAAAYLGANPPLAGEADSLAHFLTRGIDEGLAAIPVG